MCTRKEFDHWLLDFMKYYPSFGRFCTNIKEQDLEQCQNGWYRTLRNFAQTTLALVTDRMLDGDIAPIEPCDFGNFAYHIRGYAAKVADEIRQRMQRAQREEHFSGAFQAATVESAHLLPHANAAIRVSRERGLQRFEVAIATAAVTLQDNPDDTDRRRALDLLGKHGLTPECITPQPHDQRATVLHELQE